MNATASVLARYAQARLRARDGRGYWRQRRRCLDDVQALGCDARLAGQCVQAIDRIVDHVREVVERAACEPEART